MSRRPESYYHGKLDQLLLATTPLRNLAIKSNHLYYLHRMIPKLGNLATVQTLKYLSITGSHRSRFGLNGPPLDARLAEVVSGLEEVDIILILDQSPYPGDAELDFRLLRKALPILDARGILKISLQPRVSGMKFICSLLIPNVYIQRCDPFPSVVLP
jgi:hypothetical protein